MEKVGFLTQHVGGIGTREQLVKGGFNMFYDHEDPSKGYPCGADTEADARAKMLIYLLENNLIGDQLRTPTATL